MYLITYFDRHFPQLQKIYSFPHLTESATTQQTHELVPTVDNHNINETTVDNHNINEIVYVTK